ncbi:hypothetical protein VQ643_11390 [Pseudomonas sp. F1_0610]|uniref:hypothetical protein n=1 Tax=Pseudomonas sp. F1_0610 TaxID=3114284 RepID=UPI0039C4527A
MNEISDVLAMLSNVNAGFRQLGIFMLWAAYLIPLLIGIKYWLSTLNKSKVWRLTGFTYVLYLFAETVTFVAVQGVFQGYEYSSLRINLLLGAHGVISVLVITYIATRDMTAL